MSIEFRDYPGMPSHCAICQRYDCSEPGEKWVHLLTVEDQPCIGRKCLKLMFENADFNKPETREIVRPPTQEEIGQWCTTMLKVLGNEVTVSADRSHHRSDSHHHDVDLGGQRTNQVAKGKKRTHQSDSRGKSDGLPVE